ncbi:LOW QUALITY PROTEIN: sec-independent protein translocase protein TATA, chloroplastic-like [Lotus japonicus]|uniref:LOW QUALITY PROTEIN: sec-independent protein translocase protein TATA, chloroplastic-like n=1 Tax=Lotus japonicus TaxID=34305 RepID=UPI002590D584|nr:LOW QUALITY PROTEIN: sec-independent protein translocase protein TATA, chloroplastic-like [Lotus japonicus]
MEMMTLSFSSSSSVLTPRLPFSLSSSTLSFLAANSNSTSLATLRKAKTRTRRTKGLTCNALFGLGVPELVVIAGVAALVFGPKKLPEVGRNIGKTLKNFQQAAKEFESEIKKEPNSSEETLVENPTATREQGEQEIKDSV